MSPLFLRFSKQAKRAVMDAQEAAARSGAPSIEPEHLALSLVQDPEGVIARVLEAVGVEPAQVRQEIQGRLSAPSPAPLEPGAFILDPQTKRVLDSAYQEVHRAGGTWIEVEHLFLGLLQQEEKTGSCTFTSLGVTLSAAYLVMGISPPGAD